MSQNFERPSEPVVIRLGDGQDYKLRYSHKQLKQIKEELGISFMRVTGFDTVDEDKLPRLLWYGLQTYHPDVTPEDLEDKMDAAASQYTFLKIFEAATGRNPYSEKNAQSGQDSPTTTPN